MACGCAADGGEPRNTVGGALSEAAATCSGEPVAPRSTSVEEARSADAEGEAAASAIVKSAMAATVAAVSSTAWINCLRGALQVSSAFRSDCHLYFHQRLRREARCRACVYRAASLYSAARMAAGRVPRRRRPETDLEMPKLKTKSGAKKRFGRTATGKIKRNWGHKRHRLISKSTQGKRLRRGTTTMEPGDAKLVLTYMPYLRS